MNRWLSGIGTAAAIAAAALSLSACSKKPPEEAAASTASTAAPAGKVYNIGWSIYVGWMPLPYAQEAGIVKKWSDKYGVNINMVQVNEYVESLNQFTAGKLDGVASTNMDALTVPAAGGKDTTFVVVGDYSNGNDGIVLKNAKSMKDIKGRSVNLVELSVSHYLLARGLESVGMSLPDVKTVNTSDADIVAAFAVPATTATVTWNPQLSEVKKVAGATEVFDSSKIPGEILDGIVVDTAELKANPNLGKALAGIWYDMMKLMQSNGADEQAAIAQMAKESGTDVPGFQSQLSTTHLYYDPKESADFIASPQMVAGMEKVRKFSFDHGLFGQGAKSVDAIGIQFPGGKILGDPSNVKLRFDNSYAAMAAAGSL